MVKSSKEKNIGLLLLIIIFIQGVGFLSGRLGMSNQNTYNDFVKPSFSPPGWIFPIVWGILYFLMALAFYRIIIKGKQGENINKSVIYFIIQLTLNFLWAIIFFRFKLYGFAFLELLILLVFILLSIFEFYKLDKIAAYLMIPYAIWVSFAGILNCAIWILNR
ncbi:TspO/MBR family protein [Clostridium cochlearium]|uniref:Tryptophan-rich sensory protein n=2 Tax=Clostridium cochlearium TaxID=1494 RepID=A0A240A6Z9_CLOCO|nr:TspO/MBR family protein [Clostridium cochlearium]NSJ92010.1 tryptophan-rich sensory protein [Coprococcus sp. MSK.21.13]MBE6064513.1 tryptophan-rich sensory protein [Clostridium cochlearium]MCG4581181.1 tryptophan-rich sensory protein [Clostridium cochlearium]NMA57344.1 tryptophan-rich sensory protein [Clostridium cochlearium]SNV78738.1 tryptophan-rich sensory protein [Clostridium cochlearium]